MNHFKTTIPLFFTVILLAGCGQIQGMSLPFVPSPKAVVQTPSSPAEGDVTITLRIIDRELETADIVLSYSTDNGQNFSTATLTVPSEALNLATAWNPGQTHTITWDSVADGIALSGNESIILKITPSDASNPSGTEGYTGTFTVNNTTYNTPPTATLSTPAGTMSGNIPINYFLSDTESNVCSISVLYSTNDGTSWQAATMGSAGDGLTSLSSSLSGMAHMYLWDSITDGVGLSALVSTVRIRITPSDDFNPGTSGDTSSFSVDNSTPNVPPTVTITSGPADSSTVSTSVVTYEWTGNDTDGSVTGYYYSFDHDPPDVWTTDTSVISATLSEGSHTFRIVSVDDQFELSDVESRTFTVELAGTITADFSASPTSGAAPLTVDFTDLSTSTNGITSWSWTFGDMAATTEQNPQHEYSGEGTFTVSLTVTGPDGSDTETKTGYITVGGGTPDDMVRYWQDCDFGPDDGNYKLIVDGNCIKLAPEGDVFGSIYDSSNWNLMLPGDRFSGHDSYSNAPTVESGGELSPDDNSSSRWVNPYKRKMGYDDADIVIKISDLAYNSGENYGAYYGLDLFKEQGTLVQIFICIRGISPGNLWIRKVINGTFTNLITPFYFGPTVPVWFRIKRLTTIGPSNNYFYFYTSYDGISWTEQWSGQIRTATYFTENDLLYPIIGIDCEASSDTNVEPKADSYYQYTTDISAQRFWDDSPECDIIDSSAGTPEYCLDAGTGGTWTLTGCSPIVFLTGTASIKFKAGWSDSPTRATATWINSDNWMTPAELDAQVAGGALDGHRYVFLKAQFNSDGPDQPVLGPVTFTGSSSNEYTASEFDISPALDDNNQKVIVDTATAKLAPDGDEFGETFDSTNWTEVSRSDLSTSSVGEGNSSLSETGDVLTNLDGGTGEWSLLGKREISYDNFDMVLHISDTDGGVKTYNAQNDFWFWRSYGNLLAVSYRARSASSARYIVVSRFFNNTWTKIGDFGPYDLPSLYLRVKRLTTTGPSDNYFYVYYSTDGSTWNPVWSGQVRDATYFNENHSLYPVAGMYCPPTTDTFTPDFDKIYQYTNDIPAQRFWSDSPEVLVVDHTGVDWAFDAGASQIWSLWNASCVKSEPGTSSVLFKVGWSNTGNDADVTWVDSSWQTIAQVDTNAAAGNYNGHRYIHVKSQFNSDGTEQPTLSSFTIQGTKSVP